MSGKLLLALSLLVLVLSQDLHGPTYENRTRSDKLKMVWTRVIQNSQPLDWYSPLQLGELFIESMNTSFITRADDMPKQYIGGFFDRKKLVHTVGVSVLVKFKVEATQFNYTGILKTGSDSALLRFSLAAKPDIDPPLTTPGIAIKFLRDKTTAGNIFAMFGLTGMGIFLFFTFFFLFSSVSFFLFSSVSFLFSFLSFLPFHFLPMVAFAVSSTFSYFLIFFQGQASHNFFAHDLTNHPPDFGSWAPLALKTLKARFATARFFFISSSCLIFFFPFVDFSFVNLLVLLFCFLYWSF